ncbi:MAG: HlyD family efflux transporter periplasmic adaptor subunit [Oscillospiraceae bacterium]|nr:HlyD family efflux transporter periplasmic adaptor subunit [Oscillospiraceae bacterium]
MTEEKVKKREWVKNAAIIFLSVMLVLTFFSNTIMNYSLPEVSTQYVMSGSINEKIRGSGTVSVNEEYIVETEQSRKIDTVCVKVGDTVNAGDVLFILGAGDSSELDMARETLEDMELAYQIELLSIAEENYRSEKQAIDAAREALKKAKEKASELKPTVTGSMAAVTAAEKAYNEAVLEELSAQSEYDIAAEKINSLTGDEALSAEIIAYEKLYSEAEINYKAAMEILANTNPSDTEAYEKAKNTADAWAEAMANYNAILIDLAKESENLKNVYTDLYNDMAEKENVLESAKAKTAELFDALNTAKENYENYSANSEAYEAALEMVESCQLTLSNLVYDLEERMRADDVAEKINDLQMADKKKDIDKQRELVAELSGGNGENEVVAKVGGVIRELNIKAGETAQAGSTLAVIELQDRGYSLGVTVTAEQAKKVTIGDTAEVSTYWWGSNIKAVLKDIKNDAQSGGRNKILVFELTGDVEDGMNVDISIGQKSRNYDAIVPKSAVRSDSNGSFVLVLTTKSSPLGNRYTATRVDVQVIASDDVNSAVSGIGYGEYVITTASAPIEPGMLVRMAEG